MHPLQEAILNLAKTQDIGKLKLREIGSKVGKEHPQLIKHHLNQLIKKNLLIIDKNSGSISVARAGSSHTSNLVSIPILGSANCGPATFVGDERFEGMLSVSKTLLGALNYDKLFAVKAVGNSLNKADIDGSNIDSGDFVIIDSSKKLPIDNSYVLSIINGLANLKRIVMDYKNNQIILASDSSETISPIFVHENDLDEYLINGTAVKVIKNPASNYNYQTA